MPPDQLPLAGTIDGRVAGHASTIMQTAFEGLVDLAKGRASMRGHDMVNEGSSDKPRAESAFYRCRRCGAVFTVGYESGDRRGQLKIIADTATTSPCQGQRPEA